MPLICNTCGAEFTGRADARYCSGRCRTEAHRRRHAAQGGQRQPRNRRPLPDAFWTTVYDLDKKAAALERLTEDDRFPRNREVVGRRSYHDLRRTVESLQRVLDRLPEPEPLQRDGW